MEAHIEYNNVLFREDTYWRQRAKTHWLREGDLNTQFFHRSATVQRNYQRIQMLTEDGGEEIRDQEGMCGIAKLYFDTLFEVRTGVYEPVLNLIQHVISNNDYVLLTAPIVKEKLYQALTQMHPDKSSGPNGFNLAFYLNFWEICGDNIFNEAKLWLNKGFFYPDKLNDTIIFLIPNCGNPTNMNDLRPISLCNMVYKIV
ncbi:uncharacterized protein LOC131619632 [Vicia villosa]|uniref:uncharacterized protein LOC131619632 n=1 Tax=Vicia villosa TaxID=3911 RepID=UPI00273CB640|nr:uncharacterized protein LOC131619632 [Vicia villosa]